MSKNECTCDCNIIHENIVHETKQQMPSLSFLTKLANFFKLLGDPTRVQIICALDQHEMCVCDIANVLNMSKSSISHQLATLRKSGLIRFRKDGKAVYYMLDDEHIKQVFEIGFTHLEHKEKGESTRDQNQK